MDTAPATTAGLLAFDTEEDGDFWCLPTHDRHAALTAWRALSEPVSPDAPTEAHLPEFEPVWVTTTENGDGELSLHPVPAGTPSALPALTWRP